MKDLLNNLPELCQLALEAARRAGSIIDAYRERNFRVEHKDSGGSAASQVVTEVDHKAQQAIIEILEPTLQRHDLALLAEESTDNKARLDKPAFWCIDPMDGTLAFVNDVPGFSVSIALVARTGEPLIGVVYDPINGHSYHAVKGREAFRNDQVLRPPAVNPDLPLVLCTDISFRNHPWLEKTRQGLDEIATRLGLAGAEIDFRIGAVMNALCVLDKPNHCYFKYARNDNKGGSLWDYAASACLFNGARAVASDIHGAPLDLNRPDSTFMNHRGIIYSPTPTLAQQIIALNRRITCP